MYLGTSIFFQINLDRPNLVPIILPYYVYMMIPGRWLIERILDLTYSQYEVSSCCVPVQGSLIIV